MNEALAGTPDGVAVTMAQERCLDAISGLAACEACVTVCPSAAIQPGQPPAIDRLACTGCLACQAACPVDAISGHDAAPQLWNDAARQAGRTIELTCEKVVRLDLGFAEASGVIQVRGCLAGLGVGGFLGLSELRVAGVVVRSENCAACEWGSLFEQICAQVRAAAELSAARGKRVEFWLVLPVDVHVEGLKTLPAAGLRAVSRPAFLARDRKLSRRDLFRRVAYKGEAQLTRGLAAERLREGKRLGRDRARLKYLLSQPHLSADLGASLRPESAFTTLCISDACTACQTCVRICPTGALSFHVTSDTQSERFRLVFEALSCIACGLCAQLCLPGAIELNTAPSWQEILGQRQATVASGLLMQCASCRSPMAARPGVKHCPSCELRRQDPFAYRIPGRNR